MIFQVTSIYAGLLTFFGVVLSVMVIRMRLRLKVSLADGGHVELLRMIRVHGNFFEYIPTCLILMILSESAGYAAWTIHLAGVSLLVGRVGHYHALINQQLLPRQIGMVLTFLVLVSLASMVTFHGLFG